MVNIVNVGSSVSAKPADNNQVSKTKTARTPTGTENIDPAKQPKFVDRRRNPDRRSASHPPLLDTRKKGDRRKTSRLDIEV
ncbi:MAG: hypothetical protein CL691_07320 [Cellvibrionales bacterium]|nr:hypothetical protein [Cellvibrionales bacterium]|tara:strand:+ start:4797 stop:5039 length:243 start_codon:yes stop_codon:yes gene_type:complete